MNDFISDGTNVKQIILNDKFILHIDVIIRHIITEYW